MAEVGRILVVKLSALGDLFHAVPVVHRLRSHYGAAVDWVTQPEYAELIGCCRDVDEVLCFPRRGALKDTMAFRRRLRARKYDLAIDLQGLMKSGLVLGMARAGRKLSPSSPREGSGIFAGETPPATAKTPHALDRLCDTLRYLEIEPKPLRYLFDFPKSEPLPGASPRLAVAPRSRWPAKDWPVEKYIDLIRRLQQERPLDVFILGGPGDAELGSHMKETLGEGVWNLCGRRPLLELGDVLKQVDCLVCNDSGPMHFAAAVGTPLVALFGPTDPALTGPWSDRATVLRPLPGPEGYPDHRSYKQGGNAMIGRLTVEEVAAAVEARLPRRG